MLIKKQTEKTKVYSTESEKGNDTTGTTGI